MKNYWLNKLKEKEKEKSENKMKKRMQLGNILWHSVYKKGKVSKGLWLPKDIGGIGNDAT
jgi:hypothetical protein